MNQQAINSINIARGTIGRRLRTEEARYKAMEAKGQVEKLSYQAGLLTGLRVAQLAIGLQECSNE